MDWQGRGESDNVEDGESGGGGGSGFGGFGNFGGFGGGGFGGGGFRLGGGVLVVIAIIALIMGKNPLSFLGGTTDTSQQSGLPPGYAGAGNSASSSQSSSDPSPSSAGALSGSSTTKDPEITFIRVILKDTETTWDSVFRAMGKTYQKPKLHLFSDEIQSGCGEASTSAGPFYCPADRKVYLDRAFFEELTNRFQAPGDLAKAYVISHEIGHHVQNLLGISEKMDEMRGRISKTEYNRMSVKLELQADFLAGVFLHYEDKWQKVIRPGELESALKAANAVGDDKLEKAAQGYVVPDSFTHGTSKERMYWFKKGYDTGDINQGDTFAATSLDPAA